MIRFTLALGLALAACGAAPLQAKTLVFCSEGNPEGVSPQLVTTTTGMNVARQMFNNLVEFEPGTTNLKPGLAESWTVSPDGLEYTFRLRAGVRFHSNADFKPTRDMNADDVLFSLMRQWKDYHPYHRVSGAQYDYFKDIGMGDLLDDILKVDDRTVVIRLTRPEAPFLANLAMPFNAILSAEYAQRLLASGQREKLDTDPVGTGPFAFDGFQKDVAVRFRGFPDYWGGKQAIDTLVFSITPNPAVRLTKLKAGECHVMAFPNPADAAKVSSDPQLELLRQEGLNVGYLALNVTKEPFTKLPVRRAIAMAIDKAAIISAVYRGAGVPAKNPIPPTMWSYNQDIIDVPFDPDGAQRLLVEAGYPDGFETDLWYMPVSRPYTPDGRQVAEMIQADLARIGVRLNLKTADWAKYREILQAGESPMGLYGWTGDNGDPDNFLYVLLGCAAARPGGNNVAKWCHAEFESFVTRAKEIQNQSERDALYRRAQEVFHREQPWVPIAHSVVSMAIRTEVKGFKMDPLGRHLFVDVDLQP